MKQPRPCHPHCGEVKQGEYPVVALSLALIAVVLVFFVLIIARANARWKKREAAQTEVSP